MSCSKLIQWVVEMMTTVRRRTGARFIVMKFFGMGSLVRFLSLCEEKNVDLSRLVIVTISANGEVCRMWGVDAILIDSESVGKMIRDSLSAIRSIAKLRPQLVLDFERGSNLAATFRAMAAWRAGCKSIGFNLRARSTSVSTVYSIEQLSQLEIFTKGIENLPLSPRRRQRMTTAVDVRQGKVIININASDLLKSRRYEPSSFAKVIKLLMRADHGLIFYLTGTRNEHSYVQELASQFDGNHVINVAGEWTFQRFAEELSDCQLFITGDSAPLHLAASMNVATLAIWGPTQPMHFGYADRRMLASMTLNMQCSPCFLHPRSQPARACNGAITCMKRITPEMIANKALEMMSLPVEREITFPAKIVSQSVDAVA